MKKGEIKMKRRKKGIILIGVLFLLLIATGSLFAYGFLTDSTTLSLTDKTDFAKVEEANSLPSWNVYGSHIGKIGRGDLFVITPNASWTGDMTCQVTLINPDNLVATYKALAIEIQIWDIYNNQVGTSEYLTIHNNTIDIEFGQTASPYRVKITDGYYISNRAGWNSGNEDPAFLCQILQRS